MYRFKFVKQSLKHLNRSSSSSLSLNHHHNLHQSQCSYAVIDLLTVDNHGHGHNRINNKRWICSAAQRNIERLPPLNSTLITLNQRQFSSENLPKHYRVTLPALSPTMELGTIVSWEKKEGDRLNEGDLLAEIETDKATMGFETPEEGYLAKILIQAGTKDIPIGKLLCIIVPEEADIKAFADYVPTEADSKAPATADKPKPAAPPAAAAPAPAPPPSAPTPQPAVSQPQAPKSSITPVLSTIGGRIFASPFARTLAAEKGIDLSRLTGSGPGQRIRAQDVLNAPAAASSAMQFTGTSGSYEDQDLSNIRKVIARRLTAAKQSIPHYYLTSEIDITELIRVRNQMNEMLKGDNLKLSLNDFLIKASAIACVRVPAVNSSWQETFIRQYNTVDISIAVNTDNGLITPIIFGAEKLGLTDISRTMKELARKARDGQLKPEEYQGGTFTISNLGMFAVNQFAAVINPPQSCILAVGNCEKCLIPDESNQPIVMNRLTVTLSCDHRVVDGAVGAQWLKHLRQLLSKPMSMML